jgi:hypothetical protein
MLAKSIALLAVAALAQGRYVPRQTSCATPVSAAAASLVFDGRIKANTTQADFDSKTGPYGPDFVKGQSKF